MGGNVRGAAIATAAALVAVVGCELLVASDSYELARDGGASDAAFGTDADVIGDGSPSSDDGSIPIFGEPITLASGQQKPASIAIDALHVYWVNDDTRSIHRVSKDGGASDSIADAAVGAAPRISLDLFDVVYAQYSDFCGASTMHLPKSGGSPAPYNGCTLESLPRAVAVDTTHVYFTDARRNEVRRVSKVSGQEETVGGAGVPQAIALHPSGVYFTSLGDAVVVKTPLPFTQLDASVVLASAQQGALGVAVNDSFVVWTTTDAVMRAGLDGGAAPIATGEPGPSAVTIFQDVIYWTNAGDGSVRAFALGASAPKTLATGEDGPNAIATDATGVYWTTAGGSVRRLPR